MNNINDDVNIYKKDSINKKIYSLEIKNLKNIIIIIQIIKI